MIQDVEIKRNIAASRPHSLWLKEQVLTNTLLCFIILSNDDICFSVRIIFRYNMNVSAFLPPPPQKCAATIVVMSFQAEIL